MARQRATQQPELALDVPVSFGNVSIGDGTARIGLSIDRANLSISKADKQLTGRRLTGKIVAKPSQNGNPDQGEFEELEPNELELRAVFDCKRIGVGSKELSCGLTFSLADIEVEVLAKFARKNGQLVVTEIHNIPDGDGGGDEDSGDDD